MKTPRIPAPAGFRARYLSGSEAIAVLPLCRNGDARYTRDMDLPDGHQDAMCVSVSWDARKGEVRHSVCAPWLLADAFSI